MANGSRIRAAQVSRAAAPTGWRPSIGATVHASGVTFRVWAPTTTRVDLVIEQPGHVAERRPLTAGADGLFDTTCGDVEAGVRYRYVLDDDGPFPDPVSRWQPEGVHGPSLTVDPAAFTWSDAAWRGVPLRDLVLYELHVGTFSPAGTFSGVAARLPALQALGVNAIELMPVADFPGERNWGYDGVALFAPARCYGTPDDLRRLVDEAHALGIAVILDVVYNHLGPDGAYLSRFSPYYFTERHQSPWGAGIDLDGPHSARVREFFIDNALHWLHEYHMDGLRIDAIHAIHDDSPQHFLAELAARVRESVTGRHIHLIAEDDRNLVRVVMPPSSGGLGLDAVWADDFHHQARRLLAGDAEGYFRDYLGSVADLATTIRQGWFFTGQHSTHLDRARGTDPSAIASPRFVFCLQNHDQIGNRAFGDRLHQESGLAAYRAASAVLLTLPQLPLLFMGQEWAASSPFLYFTDHHPELGRLVTDGRRREFRAFRAFADDTRRAAIPDPQAEGTFLASRLDWTERDREPHAGILRLYGALITFRRSQLLDDPPRGSLAIAIDDETLLVRRTAPDAAPRLIVARLRGAGDVDLHAHAPREALGWTLVLTTEDPSFCGTPAPPSLEQGDGGLRLRFPGPAALILAPAAAAQERRAS